MRSPLRSSCIMFALDAIAPTQPSCVIVSGMVGAFAKNQSLASVRQLALSSFEQIAL